MAPVPTRLSGGPPGIPRSRPGWPALLVVLATVRSAAAETASTVPGAPEQTPVPLAPYVDPLPRPRIARPVAGLAGDMASYELSLVEFQHKLHRDLPATTVWGIDDGLGPSFPGPTLEVSQNRPVVVTWRNELRDGSGALRTRHYLPVDTCALGAPDPAPRTVMHLHGGHVPAEFAGHPEQTFLPGQSAVYQYPNWQPAATLWYHDQALGIARLNRAMGLFGFYLVRSELERSLDLPAEEFDVPLVIADRSVAADGSLIYPATLADQEFGDTLLVNGVIWPYLQVRRGKYRFRILNASNARTLRLQLSDGSPFSVIATDGALLSEPVAAPQILLAPGERLEVVIDFTDRSPGSELLLTNDAPAPYPGPPGQGVVAQVMKFVVGADLAHTGPLPIALVPVAPLSPGDAARTRDLVLDRGPAACGGQAWTIDARDWHQLTEQPRLGTSEIWRFINRSDALHSIHLQLVQFQILDRQTFTLQNDTPVPTAPAEPPAAHEAGWKDTVRIGPGEMVRIIAPFTGFAGRFAYGCEILEHQDRAMLRQFETVTSCGDGATGWPAETCDDGNTADGDGCSALCQREPTDGGDAGCGCRAASASPPGPVSWLLLALLAAPLRAIARRRAARPDRPHRRRPGRPGVPLAPRPPGGVPGRSAHGRDGATGDALTHRPDPTVATAA